VMDVSSIVGVFLNKHPLLFLIVLLCSGSFSLNVLYGNRTYAFADDFSSLVYEINIGKKEQRLDKIIDLIYQHERLERKGFADDTDIERLKDLRRAKREIEREMVKLKESERSAN